ncbi:hypothetical protein ACIG5E_37760 [Kitasatospora sp. NPDC053057]|uniref:hypothetical protein n=1 Tax=Kitasatospora sp. NPDC053057 TaxID=3364062 RepID=UPI0037CA3DA6
MSVVLPWIAHQDGGRALAELADSVSHEIVQEVRYVALEGETWPEGHRHDRVHEVDVAVELVMSSGARLILSWAMDGLNEGLAIDFRSVGDDGPNLTGSPVVVSHHKEWQKFIGSSFTSVVPGWHIPNEGCPEMPWSFRLESDALGSVVIALGESVGGDLKYQPDALLVIFDQMLSTSYAIPASSTSSWG